MGIIEGMKTDSVITQWRDQQRAYLETAASLDRALEQEYDLGLSEFEILDLVWEAKTEECAMRDIVDLTPMTQSALSRVVDRLTRAGLVERKECSYDRRSMFVGLPAEGQRVHEECTCSHERIMGMMRRFSGQDRRDMVGDNGRIGITCEFCSRFYDLDPAEVEAEIAKTEA